MLLFGKQGQRVGHPFPREEWDRWIYSTADSRQGMFHFWDPPRPIYGFTCGFEFMTDSTASTAVMAGERDYTIFSPENSSKWQVNLDSSGRINLYIFVGATTKQQYRTTGGYNDNTPYQCQVCWSSGLTITNGTFASDTGWTKTGTWAIGSGTANGTTENGKIYQTNTSLVRGQKYRVKFDVTAQSAGTVTPVIFTDTAEVRGTARSTVATFQEHIECPPGENPKIGFLGTGFTGSIDNVSVPDYDLILVDGSSVGSQISHVDILDCLSVFGTAEHDPPFTAMGLCLPASVLFGGWMRRLFYLPYYDDSTDLAYEDFVPIAGLQGYSAWPNGYM